MLACVRWLILETLPRIFQLVGTIKLYNYCMTDNCWDSAGRILVFPSLDMRALFMVIIVFVVVN